MHESCWCCHRCGLGIFPLMCVFSSTRVAPMERGYPWGPPQWDNGSTGQAPFRRGDLDGECQCSHSIVRWYFALALSQIEIAMGLCSSLRFIRTILRVANTIVFCPSPFNSSHVKPKISQVSLPSPLQNTIHIKHQHLNLWSIKVFWDRKRVRIGRPPHVPNQVCQRFWDSFPLVHSSEPQYNYCRSRNALRRLPFFAMRQWIPHNHW